MDRLSTEKRPGSSTTDQLNILLSQTASIGDIILTTPLIAVLSARYPSAKITVLTTPAGVSLLSGDKRIHELIGFDKRKDSGITGLIRQADRLRNRRFDVVYAVQRSSRFALLFFLSGIRKRVAFSGSGLPQLYSELVARATGVHEVQRNLSLLAPLTEDEATSELGLPDEPVGVSVAAKELAQRGKYIALFPGSLWETKRWPKHHWIRLALRLKEKGLSPLVVGAPSESSLVQEVADAAAVESFATGSGLQDASFLVKNADAVVCNDSAPLHLASAFKVPNVAIFCATVPEMGFGPYRNKATVVQREKLWCKPCARHGGRFCPTGSHACMEEVSPETVLSSLLTLLDQK